MISILLVWLLLRYMQQIIVSAITNATARAVALEVIRNCIKRSRNPDRYHLRHRCPRCYGGIPCREACMVRSYLQARPSGEQLRNALPILSSFSFFYRRLYSK